MNNTVKKLTTNIDERTKLSEMIRILEENGMDEMYVNKKEKFLVEIDEVISLKELKEISEKNKLIKGYTMGDVLWTDLEKCLGHYADETNGGESIDGSVDFDETNKEIAKRKTPIKIETGEDLLKVAKDTLPELIKINVSNRYALLNISASFGDHYIEEQFDSELGGQEIAILNKEDVLKTISSDFDKWTDDIKKSSTIPLQYLMERVICDTDGYPSGDKIVFEVSSNGMGEFHLDNDCVFDNDKYFIKNLENSKKVA